MKEMGKIISFYKSQLVMEGGVYQPLIGTGGVQQPLNVTKLNAKQDSIVQLDEENNEKCFCLDEEYKDVENRKEEKESKAEEQAQRKHLKAQRIEATRREAARREATLFQQHLEAERKCEAKRSEQMDFFGYPLHYPQMNHFGYHLHYPQMNQMNHFGYHLYYPQMDHFGYALHYTPYGTIWHPVSYYGMNWY